VSANQGVRSDDRSEEWRSDIRDAFDTRENEVPHLSWIVCRGAHRRGRVRQTGDTEMSTTSDSRTETFIKLFAESRQALHRYIRRFVRSSETAKEIVQEAFLRTYQERESVITPRAFLFSTARNLAANEIRHRRTVERDALGHSDDMRVDAEYESVESRFLRDERNRLVQQAINRLPPQCRAAFALRVFHQYSYKEIAGHLRISVKTVEKHVARGIRETNRYLTVRYSATGRHHG
jgi:RNA polymerase sigma-70 factor (family 1)